MSTGDMTRHEDLELWREVSRTMLGLTTIVETFAKRVCRADRLDLAKAMLKHADHLATAAERRKDERARSSRTTRRHAS